jgi:hypothetical protein
MKSNKEWLESLSDEEVDEIIDNWKSESIEEDLLDPDSLKRFFDNEYEDYLLDSTHKGD